MQKLINDNSSVISLKRSQSNRARYCSETITQFPTQQIRDDWQIIESCSNGASRAYYEPNSTLFTYSLNFLNSWDSVQVIPSRVIKKERSVTPRIVRVATKLHDQTAEKNIFNSPLVTKVYALFDANKDFLNGIVLKDLNKKIDLVVSQIYTLSPSKIAVELTTEKSIYYTLKIHNKILFIDHYLELEDKSQELDGDNSELIISVFENKFKVFGFAGSLTESLSELIGFFK